MIELKDLSHKISEKKAKLSSLREEIMRHTQEVREKVKADAKGVKSYPPKAREKDGDHLDRLRNEAAEIEANLEAMEEAKGEIFEAEQTTKVEGLEKEMEYLSEQAREAFKTLQEAWDKYTGIDCEIYEIQKKWVQLKRKRDEMMGEVGNRNLLSVSRAFTLHTAPFQGSLYAHTKNKQRKDLIDPRYLDRGHREPGWILNERTHKESR